MVWQQSQNSTVQKEIQASANSHSLSLRYSNFINVQSGWPTAWWMSGGCTEAISPSSLLPHSPAHLPSASPSVHTAPSSPVPAATHPRKHWPYGQLFNMIIWENLIWEQWAIAYQSLPPWWFYRACVWECTSTSFSPSVIYQQCHWLVVELKLLSNYVAGAEPAMEWGREGLASLRQLFTSLLKHYTNRLHPLLCASTLPITYSTTPPPSASPLPNQDNRQIITHLALSWAIKAARKYILLCFGHFTAFFSLPIYLYIRVQDHLKTSLFSCTNSY